MPEEEEDQGINVWEKGPFHGSTIKGERLTSYGGGFDVGRLSIGLSISWTKNEE